MNGQNDNQDHELRDLLGQAGRSAEQRAPSFQRTWSAARRLQDDGPTPVWRPQIAWALALVFIVTAVGVGLRWQRSAPDGKSVASTEPATTALTEALAAAPTGRMPTDFLLSPGGDAPPQSVAQLANDITELLRP